MAEAKTKPTAVSVDQFLEGVTPPQRAEDAPTLIGIVARLSGEPATMWGPSIIGFGVKHYRYPSGRTGSTCAVGFSPRKPALVLYVYGATSDAARLERLGKVTHGKSCVYVKRLADIDLCVLEGMIAESLAADAVV